jgi:hypothetical protein
MPTFTRGITMKCIYVLLLSAAALAQQNSGQPKAEPCVVDKPCAAAATPSQPTLLPLTDKEKLDLLQAQKDSQDA